MLSEALTGHSSPRGLAGHDGGGRDVSEASAALAGTFNAAFARLAVAPETEVDYDVHVDDVRRAWIETAYGGAAAAAYSHGVVNVTSSEPGGRREDDPDPWGVWTIDGYPCRAEVELTLSAGRWRADRVAVDPAGRPPEGAGASDLEAIRAKAAAAVEEAFNAWLTTHEEQALDLAVQVLGRAEKVAEASLALAKEEVRILERRAQVARGIREELIVTRKRRS
jgi:hypothetical protein